MYSFFVFLRLVHIMAGAFWVGAALMMTFFISPTVNATEDSGRNFMRHFMGKTKFNLVMWSAAHRRLYPVLDRQQCPPIILDEHWPWCRLQHQRYVRLLWLARWCLPKSKFEWDGSIGWPDPSSGRSPYTGTSISNATIWESIGSWWKSECLVPHPGNDRDGYRQIFIVLEGQQLLYH